MIRDRSGARDAHAPPPGETDRDRPQQPDYVPGGEPRAESPEHRRHGHEQDTQPIAGHDAGHVEMVRKWSWRDFTNIILGVWLISSPFTLGYSDARMLWSDVVSGAAVVVFAALVLSPRFDI